MTSDPVRGAATGWIGGAGRRLADGAAWCATGGLEPGLRPVLSRSLRARPLRAARTAAAVGLGVAVMLAVQIELAAVGAQANAAARLRAGGSSLDVRATAGAGLSARELAAAAGIPGVREAVPLYQKRVTAQGPLPDSPTTVVTLVGLQDGGAALRGITLSAGRLPAASSSDEIAIDTALRPALASGGSPLELGSSILLTSATGPRAFRVVGLTDAGGVSASFTHDVIFVPAPDLLHSFGLGLSASLDALRLAPGTSAARVAAAVHERLGGSVTTLDPSADSGDPLAQLSPLLLMEGVLSLVIGAGVSANTVSLAALERRRDIGLLRAAGASASQVFHLLGAEALLLALAGSLAGVAAGIGLGAGVQAAFSGGAGPALGGLRVSVAALALAVAAGVAAAVAASAIPAVVAARVPILDALNSDAAGGRERVHPTVLGAVPPLLALAALADLSGGGTAPLGGVALLLAVALSLPLLVPWAGRLLGRVLGLVWPEVEVAAATLRRRRNRTALTLAGLVTAVAAATAGSILVSGSLAAGDAWVSHLFVGDTLIRSPVTERSDIASQIGQAAGVRLTALRFFSSVVDGDVIGMTAFDSATYQRQNGLDLVGGNRSAAFATLADGPSLLAPLSLAQADDWQVGTVLAVATGSTTTDFTVAGIVEHSFPAGDGREALLVDQRQATRFFGAEASGFDDLEVLTAGRTAAVEAVAARYGLAATPLTAIVSATRQSVGDAVGILPAIAWVSIAIAFLAVVNTLTVNVRQGRRELGLLRAVGLSQVQARRLVLSQAGLLGAIAGVLGVGVGCLLALPVLAAGGSPGFAPAFVLPASTVVALVVGLAIAVMVAGALPARRAAGVDIISAVQHE